MKIILYGYCGVFLAGITTGAIFVFWIMWGRLTELEYENCSLRRQNKDLEQNIGFMKKQINELKNKKAA